MAAHMSALLQYDEYACHTISRDTRSSVQAAAAYLFCLIDRHSKMGFACCHERVTIHGGPLLRLLALHRAHHSLHRGGRCAGVAAASLCLPDQQHRSRGKVYGARACFWGTGCSMTVSKLMPHALPRAASPRPPAPPASAAGAWYGAWWTPMQTFLSVCSACRLPLATCQPQDSL